MMPQMVILLPVGKMVALVACVVYPRVLTPRVNPPKPVPRRSNI